MLRNALDKLITVFCLLVLLTFLINHGHIDFSLFDKVHDKVVEAVKSPEGQECIEETKDISKDLFLDILHAIDRLLTGNKDAGTTEG